MIPLAESHSTVANCDVAKTIAGLLCGSYFGLCEILKAALNISPGATFSAADSTQRSSEIRRALLGRDLRWAQSPLLSALMAT
jgi:hypothetical protein